MEFGNMHAQAHGGMDMDHINNKKANKMMNYDQERHNSNKLLKFASANEEIKIEADDYQQQRSFRDQGVKKAVDPRIRLLMEGEKKNKDLSTNSQSANHTPRQGFAFNNPNKDVLSKDKAAMIKNAEDSVVEEADENFAS